MTMTSKLGAGNFGEVWKATLVDGSNPHEPECLVAAKIVLNAAAGKDEFSADNAGALAAEKDLIQEALLMAQVDQHPHLVAIVGVVTRGNPKVLVVSFCELGELQGLLRKRASDGGVFGARLKHRFCSQIAAGMAHLALHNFVHRDLAARNVLLAWGMVCKVADFGLSRRVQTEDNSGDYYRSTHGGLLPVRWTAPESLMSQKFSSASDVWSFAITCIEVYQDGLMPYPDVRSNPQVITNVTAGQVHSIPVGCSQAVYSKLCECWHFEPERRPLFAALSSFFHDLHVEASLVNASHALPVETETHVSAQQMKRENPELSRLYGTHLPDNPVSQYHPVGRMTNMYGTVRILPKKIDDGPGGGNSQETTFGTAVSDDGSDEDTGTYIFFGNGSATADGVQRTTDSPSPEASSAGTSTPNLTADTQLNELATMLSSSPKLSPGQ